MIDSEEQVGKFAALLSEAFEENTFVRLVLAKYRGEEEGLKRVVVRRVTLKEEDSLSFVYSYETKDITKNTSIAEGLETIGGLIGSSFKNANLFCLTQDVQILFSKKGKCKWRTNEPSHTGLPSKDHDHKKERLIDPASRFLSELRVTDAQHRVRPSMSRKWKQINKFLEVFQGAYSSSKLAEKDCVDVVDFGSGKGYLTFAVQDYLRKNSENTLNVTGIELRPDLVGLCNSAAKKLGADGLSFHQGDLGSYTADSIDIMIALHACDTATDDAIYMGIRAGAEIIMCSPCCHKEIRGQIKSPKILEPMLKSGIHLGQEAEMVTDALRALLLEANGYRTQIIEFVSLEHTGKNKMVLAVAHSDEVDKDGILKQVEQIKDFYSIKTQHLEGLLG